MKKFFTIIPLQGEGQLREYRYEACGNGRLQMETETAFPILCAVNGYAEAGEEIRVVTVNQQGNADVERNREAFARELDALCAARNVRAERVDLFIPRGQSVSEHTKTFQKLIGQAEDGDELFACMTYGTKPESKALLMAVQYAYRVKTNASISCIVYGQVDRDVTPNRAFVYDETALYQLDELVRVLADTGVTDPAAVIDTALNL